MESEATLWCTACVYAWNADTMRSYLQHLHQVQPEQDITAVINAQRQDHSICVSAALNGQLWHNWQQRQNKFVFISIMSIHSILSRSHINGLSSLPHERRT